VAIKIIRSGLVTQPVSMRFNREYQVLARMEHPNIAAVFDAGELPDGRTYFVMEIVSGSPITTWCIQHDAPVRERLTILLQACLAVQHAHQKGIPHRDIKPSNVLVSTLDGRPLVKVIDFGISKALEGDLSLGTDMTLRGTVLGTPRYMSPEQAGLTGQDVDTRADVYALGVMLYELLTGTTPIAEAHDKDETLPELLHRVRQTEIELPSRRVTRLTKKTKLLVQELRGELDWVVLRALEKDRERRYPTVLSFAEDLHRYLLDEPVIAAPPSSAYRLKKWFVRNKSGIASAAAVVISLAGGIVATLWALEREETQRREVLKQTQTARSHADLARQVGDQLQELLINARRHADAGMNTQMLRKLADECAAGMSRFADQPQAEAELAGQLAKLYSALEERTRALPWFERHWQLLKKTEGEKSPDTLTAFFELGTRSLALISKDRAIEYLRAAAEGFESLAESDARMRARALLTRKELARALSLAGRHDESLALFEKVIRLKGINDPLEVSAWLREQADALRSAGRLQDSAAALQRALALLPQERKHIARRAYILSSLATTSQLQEHYDEALEASSARLGLLEEEYGTHHPRVLNALIEHAFLTCLCPGCPGGEDTARKALSIAKATGHESRLVDAWMALSEVQRMMRKFSESEQTICEAIEDVSQTRAEYWRILELHRRLGDLLVARGEYEGAWEQYEIAADGWFAESTVGRSPEKERLIFESIIAFYGQAATAQSPFASSEKLAEWQQRLKKWEDTQPDIPGAHKKTKSVVP
jgi:serine/threonine protein kinase/tetratricopeptide (TPR) repeat protein